MSRTTRMVLAVLAELFMAMSTAVSGAMVQAGTAIWPAPVVFLLGFVIGFGRAWAEVKAWVSEEAVDGAAP